MNKTTKSILTITMMCIILGSVFYIKNSIEVTNIQKVMDTFDDILVTQVSVLTDSTRREIHYSAQLENCPIQYRFLEIKDKYNFMGMRYLNGCKKNFQDQLPVHRRILKRAKQDWNFQSINTLNTDGARVIDPSLSWVKKIISKAMESEDVLDYKKNYPNHKSKKSINTILIEIINESNAFEELLSLYREFKLNFKVVSCEKVFQMNNKRAKELGIGIGKNKSIIYDAGTYSFSHMKETSSPKQ